MFIFSKSLFSLFNFRLMTNFLFLLSLWLLLLDAWDFRLLSVGRVMAVEIQTISPRFIKIFPILSIAIKAGRLVSSLQKGPSAYA